MFTRGFNFRGVSRILFAVIFSLPLLMLLSKSFYPVNISQITLLVICEATMIMLVYLLAAKAKTSPQWLENKLVFNVSGGVIALLFLIVGLAYFTNRFTSLSESGEKVLLPLKCSGKLCELYEIAKQHGQEVAERYGKDGIVDKINFYCKGDFFKAEFLYDLLVCALYLTLSFVLVLINLFYWQKTFYETSYTEEVISEYQAYVNAYLNKKDSADATPNVFLSYTSSDLATAEQLYFSLKHNHCNVFFDRSTLSVGEEYNMAIYKAVRCSDVFVFLISNSSIKPKKYTLTELKYASTQPNLKLIPVLLDETTVFDNIPAYAKSVTILRPEGNLVAEATVIILNNWKK